MSDLIPVDLTRCQAEKPNGATFMTLGGVPKLIRCNNVPTVIATEIEPDPMDGQIGSMSLCDDCKSVLLKQVGDDYATFKSISESVAQ